MIDQVLKRVNLLVHDILYGIVLQKNVNVQIEGCGMMFRMNVSVHIEGSGIVFQMNVNVLMEWYGIQIFESDERVKM